MHGVSTADTCRKVRDRLGGSLVLPAATGMSFLRGFRHFLSTIERTRGCIALAFGAMVNKKKVNVQVYGLVTSAKRHSPDFTQSPPGHRTCSFMSQLNTPCSIQPGCNFRRTELVKHTSLQCPTRYPLAPGSRECTCQQSALPRSTTSEPIQRSPLSNPRSLLLVRRARYHWATTPHHGSVWRGSAAHQGLHTMRWTSSTSSSEMVGLSKGFPEIILGGGGAFFSRPLHPEDTHEVRAPDPQDT